MVEDNSDLCFEYVGEGKNRHQCRNKGKYKQYPNDSPNTPKVCGVHVKAFREWQKMMNGMTGEIFSKVLSK